MHAFQVSALNYCTANIAISCDLLHAVGIQRKKKHQVQVEAALLAPANTFPAFHSCITLCFALVILFLRSGQEATPQAFNFIMNVPTPTMFLQREPKV